MEVAAQNLPKLIAAIVLTAIAAILTGWIFALGASPESLISAAATGKGSGRSESGGKKNAEYSKPFDPTLNFARLELSEGADYQGTGRNIFSTALERQQEKVPPKAKVSVSWPTRPPASLLRLKFFGFANSPNGRKKLFLSQDGDVFVGREGEIVNRRYKIVRITPASVDLEDLLENSQHTLSLQQG